MCVDGLCGWCVRVYCVCVRMFFVYGVCGVCGCVCVCVLCLCVVFVFVVVLCLSV